LWADYLADRSTERRNELVAFYFNLPRRAMKQLCGEAGIPDAVRRREADDLESLGHEAILRAVPRYRTDGGASPATFLRQAIRFAVRGWWRDFCARADRENVVSIEAIEAATGRPFDCEGREEDPAVAAEREEEQGLEHRLTSLPACDREILRLRFEEGATLANIGRRLGLPERTVANRLKRSMRRVRRQLSVDAQAA
jgi:RNA polymerase sigma factor (sigma-70 family)